MKYLIFNEDGEIIEDNIIETTDGTIEFGSSCITLNFNGNHTDTIVSGQVFINGWHIRVEQGNALGRYYMLATMVKGNIRFSAIVNHIMEDEMQFQLFFKFAEFFLPTREPHCCCKSNYNKVLLPYINKVFRSMVKHYNYEEYYNNLEYTKNNRLERIMEEINQEISKSAIDAAYKDHHIWLGVTPCKSHSVIADAARVIQEAINEETNDLTSKLIESHKELGKLKTNLIKLNT